MKTKPKTKWTAKKIRQARLDNDLTQKQLAEKMGMSTIQISFYETGRTPINSSRAAMLDLIFAQLN